MSSSRQMAKTLDAWRLGKPLQRGTTKLAPLAPPNQVAFVAFVRMGGESTPWGMAIKPANDRVPTKYFITPDPRKRTELAKTLRTFGKFLCKWISQDPVQNGWPHAQIWLPNPSHFDMLHGLALRYIWSKYVPEGMSERHSDELRKMGRAANWLFYESQHPGQTVTVSATDALKSCFYFPSDNLRQAHLGFLLAWLETSGNKAAREYQAELAEQESISPTLNPSVESGPLDRLVQKFGDPGLLEESRESVANKISEIIKAELEHRINLTQKAYKLLQEDQRSVNEGFQELALQTRERMERDYIQNERRAESGEMLYIPDPDSDKNPRKASEIYMEREKSNASASAQILKNDSELQEIAISSGDAIRGKVVQIEHRKERRTNVITWMIESDSTHPLRLRIGDKISVNNLSANELSVLNVEIQGDLRIITLNVLSPKTARGGLDMKNKDLLDQEFVFLKLPASIPLFRKITNLRSRNSRGVWLADQIMKIGKRNA